MSIYLDRIGLNEPQIQVKIQHHGYWFEQQAVKNVPNRELGGLEQTPLIQEQGYQIYARVKASFEQVGFRIYLGNAGMVSINLAGDRAHTSPFPQNQNVTVTRAWKQAEIFPREGE